ncbi:type I-E CRISPR-associated protein Cse1/CasA [Tomitella fengzijianii]|uniref:Type I-E CRISPR-associated protein Cse1/CasA n=1 Tax=Tomitella fengzijianii TaxID=2597660 RepID=A0A516X689_9ACTN|nr:type I-E CRISPR-associated protein Cse1/CasA [Tomitella fengzijianii]QDQ98565.1 type I-E CRISPR-associated protein Cse1/CasA [Tomitella fengzijianii]
MTFNLIDEPWIVVRRIGGEADTVSLRTLFAEAPRIRRLAGELPTQDFAVLRIALAVLYRAVAYEIDSAPTTVAEELWEAPGLPLDQVDAYLDQWHDRFELFDDHAPFMQVADLASPSGAQGDVRLLLPDAPRGEPLFTMRSAVDSLTFAEAARWLAHCQAYDFSGIKTGAVGDPRVKGGKGYPMGIGWAGWLGGVVVEGDSLHHTLLLNLVLEDELRDDDLPVWEHKPLTAAPRPPHAIRPRGPAGLFTWPQRRIRLFRTDDAVDAVLVCNGDPVPYTSQIRNEPMTAWRYSEPQSKKFKSTVYMPRAHDPERSFWRGLATILSGGERSGRENKTHVAASVPPTVVTWAGDLVAAGILPREMLIRACAVGIEYGAQSSSYGNLIADDLVFHPVIAQPGDVPQKLAVLQAVEHADRAVSALASLGGDIAIASGGERGPAAQRARASGYHALDSAFREWVSTVRPDSDVAALDRQWSDRCGALIRAESDVIIAAAGPAAWIGREHDGKPLTVGHADARFRRTLASILPFTPTEERPA